MVQVPAAAQFVVALSKSHSPLLSTVKLTADLDYFGNMQKSQVSYRFLALGCFPANLVSDVVCVLFVLRVGSLKG